MGPGEVVPALVSGVSRGIGRLAEPHDHRHVVLAVSIVVAAAAVVFVEVHFGACSPSRMPRGQLPAQGRRVVRHGGSPLVRAVVGGEGLEPPTSSV